MNSFENAKVYKLKNAIDYSEGAIVSKTLVNNDGGNVSLFAFDKGQKLSEHTAPFNALAHIIEGHAQIQIADDENSLADGDIIIMPANIPHAVLALEKFKMVLTMIKAI